MNKLSEENYERIVELTGMAENMMSIIDNESLRHECDILGTVQLESPVTQFTKLARGGKYDHLSDEAYNARVDELKSISESVFYDQSSINACYRGAMAKLKQDMTAVMEHLRELSILNKVDASMEPMRVDEILDPEADCSWISDGGISTMTDEELKWSRTMQESEGEWV